MPKSGWESWGPEYQRGDGRETWQRFGRRMFFGFTVFVLFAVTGLVALGALLAVLISSVDFGAAVGAVALIVIMLAVLGGLIARGIRRSWLPVRDLIRAAGAVADGDYAARAKAPSSRTVQPVIGSFNKMASELERAASQRRQLLADLGHELRTPLTVVRGEIEAMIDGVHDVDSEHLELLLDEVTVMERLLVDLRTLSLTEAGALDLHIEQTDLSELVGDVAGSYRRAASDSGIAVRTQLDEDLTDVDVDPVRIREVVTNLVVNALGAMPDGGTLLLTAERKSDQAVIEVRDTGTGIEGDDLRHVFDRFQKGAMSPGSGLGLTISRDLVEAHGGTIDISSEPGTGTVVRVTLPVA